jgi:hypothetical protein
VASERELRLAERLFKMPDASCAKVLLEGEFLTAKIASYGHMSKYKHEFIVHRVLSISNDISQYRKAEILQKASGNGRQRRAPPRGAMHEAMICFLRV